MKSNSSNVYRLWWCLNLAGLLVLMSQCHSSRSSSVPDSTIQAQDSARGVSSQPVDSGVGPVQDIQEVGRHTAPDQHTIDSLKAVKNAAKRKQADDQ